MKRILLFDTIIDGHHPDYLSHLITYWLHNQPEGELIVVAPASFISVFNQLTGGTSSTLQFVPISSQEITETHHGSVLKRSFKEWNLLLMYARKHRATHVLMMYFDIFQMGLLLGSKPTCNVSGIYFRPDFHYTNATTLKARLTSLRKKATLQGILNRRILKTLFCLDRSAVPLIRSMNAHINVLHLPDPVKSFAITPDDIQTLRSTLRIESDRKVFLLFGNLDDRKGIEAFLDALPLTDTSTQSKICFLLAGSIHPDYQQQIEQKMASLRISAQIITVFREIRGKEIQAYFELADYVLALYRRHIGMASVIIRAAVSGKPVLASDYGYVGHLVKAEQLGPTADSDSPEAISHLLKQVINQDITYSKTNLKKLAEANSNVTFAQTVFNNL